jgi:hypothetical protein
VEHGDPTMSESTRRVVKLAARRRKCLRGASAWRDMATMFDRSSWERVTAEAAEHRWLCAADRCHTKIVKELETTECH